MCDCEKCLHGRLALSVVLNVSWYSASYHGYIDLCCYGPDILVRVFTVQVDTIIDLWITVVGYMDSCHRTETV